MAPVTKHRGVPRQPELALEKYVPGLDGVPDESVLGRLQEALEALLSERSHPMMVGLSKQLDQLKTAENVIQREIDVRRRPLASGSTNKRKRAHRAARSDRGTPTGHEDMEIDDPADLEAAAPAAGVPDDTDGSGERSAPGSAGGSGGPESVDLKGTNEDSDDADADAADAENAETAGAAAAEAEATDGENPADADSGDNEVEADDADDDDEDNDEDEDNDDGDADDEQEVGPGAEGTEAGTEAEDGSESGSDPADPSKAAHRPAGESSTDEKPDLYAESNADAKDAEDDSDAEAAGDSNEARGDGVKLAGNKKFVANPKSEFVATQTMPYHTLGIFDEDSKDEDEEMHKRRLGVVSYPKEDLSTLTAGPVPMEDFTRAKPSNQVQFSTYATFLEPYFRPFTDEDIQFLQQPAIGSGIEAANLQGGKRLSPFAFPPLGPHYRQQWAAQDAELSGVELSEADRKAAAARVASLSHMMRPAGGVNDISDPNLESQNSSVSLGPFTERLVAAVMAEVYDSGTGTPLPGNNGGLDTDDGNASTDYASPPIEKAISAIPPAPAGTQLIEDFGHLEERVKGEFRYVGVLDMSLLRKFEKTKSDFKLALPRSQDEYADPSVLDMDWVNGAEDDEVSRELRLLQRRLREVSRRNAFYKSRLIPVVQEQLSWQEYQSILQDLDKQVDQAYQKRLKQPKVIPPKPKKRKGSTGFDSPDPASPMVSTPEPVSKLPDQKPTIKALIDKRERWISKIGPLFRPSHEMMREYLRPKFENIDEDYAPDEEDEDEREE